MCLPYWMWVQDCVRGTMEGRTRDMEEVRDGFLSTTVGVEGEA